MIYEIILIVLIIAYIILIYAMVKGGIKMFKKARKRPEGFTAEQWAKLREVQHKPGKYSELAERYRAWNNDKRYGRVLGLDGSVYHEGWEVIKGKKK